MLFAEVKLRRITQAEALIILHITRKPNSIIVLLFIEKSRQIIESKQKIIKFYPARLLSFNQSELTYYQRYFIIFRRQRFCCTPQVIDIGPNT